MADAAHHDLARVRTVDSGPVQGNANRVSAELVCRLARQDAREAADGRARPIDEEDA